LDSLEFIKNGWDAEANSWNINSKDYLIDFYKNFHDTDFDYFNLLFEGSNTKNSHVLEYGCGWGRNIKNFSNNFKYIDGCDISENQIKKAKSYLVDVKNYSLFVTDGKFSFQLGLHPILSPELSRVSNIYMYNYENLSSIFNRLDIGKEENLKNTLEQIGFKNYKSKITNIKDDFYEGFSFKTQMGYDKFLWVTVEK
jgi:hypothetical protein